MQRISAFAFAVLSCFSREYNYLCLCTIFRYGSFVAINVCPSNWVFVLAESNEKESLLLLYSTPVAVWVSFIFSSLHFSSSLCCLLSFSSISFLFSTVLRMIEQHANSAGFVFVYCARAQMRDEPPNWLFDHYSYVCHFYSYRLMIFDAFYILCTLCSSLNRCLSLSRSLCLSFFSSLFFSFCLSLHSHRDFKT